MKWAGPLWSSADMFRQLDFPEFIYGTAWKEERTAEFSVQAVRSGFRAVDTANQKKHYREDFLGKALQQLEQEGISRSHLFLQSKFTYPAGQDHRLPYRISDPVEEQVISSFNSTLKNLHTSYLDSYLVHGPSTAGALRDEDWRVWSTFEKLFSENNVKCIGISNVSESQLRELLQHSKIKPMTVQNRCFAATQWDSSVRQICRENGIAYQGFSLLTANQRMMSHPTFQAMRSKYRVTEAQLVFRFCRNVGIVPLTGSTQALHLKEDLQCGEKLEPEDAKQIEFLMSVRPT